MARTQTKQVLIRLTEADYEALKRKIEKSGLSQVEYIRKAVLDKKIISTEGVKALMPELKRIGNNINQTARRCNQGYPAVYEEVKKQREELGAIWQLLRQFHHGQA